MTRPTRRMLPSRVRSRPGRALAGLLAAALGAVALTACAGTTSSSKSFTGEAQGVSETLSTLQSAATSNDPEKICSEVIASSVKAKFPNGCVAALREQLTEIDNFELTVEAVHIEGSKATATVKSVEAGKPTQHKVSLVREGRTWKLASLD